MSIQNTYINDDEEQDRVLEVGVHGDLAFLSIGTFDGRFDVREFNTVQDGETPTQIAVPLSSLINALVVHVIAQERDDLAATGAQLRPTRLG